MDDSRRTEASRWINAPPARLFAAYVEAEALARWLPPGSMTGVVHTLEARVGGMFQMSLFYSETDDTSLGKTTESSGSFSGRFVDLIPDSTIVWAVQFQSDDPAFSGEMLVTTTLAQEEGGTRVSMRCDNIPPGIKLEDNTEGTRLSLEQLAAFVERA